MDLIKKEKLERKYAGTNKALKSLERAVSDFQKKEKNNNSPQELETYRDSMIQRFKYSIDTTWKYLKDYLLFVHNIEHTYPKQVFQECLRAKLLTQDETVTALQMVDHRNETSHAYNENVDFCW
jgi:nucleotidyltransferase substrate binding protein (TIGR01987 family)